MKQTLMNRLLIALFLCCLSPFAYAEKAPETKATDKIITLEVEDDFEFIKENIKAAILEQGLLVRDELHINEMLENTKNIGEAGELFSKAEVIEFCSSVITHKMAALNPANISNCPFSISIYALAKKPDVLYLSYQTPNLIGEKTEALEAEITKMHKAIISAASE